MLSVQSLAFDYGDKPLLGDISLAVSAGEIWHIQGANGRGKTTLLKLIAGLLKPHSGAILWQNQPIEDNLEGYQNTLWYWGNRVGLSRQLSLWEECVLQQRLFSWSYEQAKPYIQALELDGKLDTLIGALSLGQQRKAGLLMMLMAQKKLWILDEPLLALDTKSLTFFWQALAAHQQAGGMAILSSHQALTNDFGSALREYRL